MIEVKTQTQLDAALKKTRDGRDGAVRCVGDAEFVVSDSATVYAYGSARVSASGSARVTAYGSARVTAYGSATVTASDSATVYAYGSATVYASGSATVYAYDSARVTASDSATVSAYGSATVYSSEHVAIHIKSQDTTIQGGVQITPPEPQALTVADALHEWGLEGDTVTLYKAVDADLKSGYGFLYPIGETVECDDWNDRPECGGGLHLSPTPHHATRYMREASRWLECEVVVGDLAVTSTRDPWPDKLKARRVRVVREVGMDMKPVGESA